MLGKPGHMLKCCWESAAATNAAGRTLAIRLVMCTCAVVKDGPAAMRRTIGAQSQLKFPPQIPYHENLQNTHRSIWRVHMDGTHSLHEVFGDIISNILKAIGRERGKLPIGV